MIWNPFKRKKKEPTNRLKDVLGIDKDEHIESHPLLHLLNNHAFILTKENPLIWDIFERSEKTACLGCYGKTENELTEDEKKLLSSNYVQHPDPKTIITVNFRSSEESWKNLSGRDGFIFICKEHLSTIGHHWTSMS